MSQEQNNTASLNVLISRTGYCSRREADRLIEGGKVKVNGLVHTRKGKVDVDSHIVINGKPLKVKDKTVYIVLNKPVGVICTTDQDIKGNIVDFMGYPSRIFPIGRLDKPSEGLIMMTNDGDIVNKILRAGNAHEKEYVVTVDKKITSDFVQKMSNGVPILDTVTKKCVVRKDSSNTFTIVLTQGLNRQIRRMCEYLGFSVTRLVRKRIMNLSLNGLGKGEWRYLSKNEESIIKKSISMSSGTEEASKLAVDSKSSKRKSKPLSKQTKGGKTFKKVKVSNKERSKRH